MTMERQILSGVPSSVNSDLSVLKAMKFIKCLFLFLQHNVIDKRFNWLLFFQTNFDFLFTSFYSVTRKTKNKGLIKKNF